MYNMYFRNDVFDYDTTFKYAALNFKLIFD